MRRNNLEEQKPLPDNREEYKLEELVRSLFEKKEEVKKMKKKGSIIFNLDNEKRFWLADGRVIKNLFELSRAFEEMSDETYSHHANDAKNDFSNWAADVFGERKLAQRLTEVSSKEKSQIAVLKHMVSALTKK